MSESVHYYLDIYNGDDEDNEDNIKEEEEIGEDLVEWKMLHSKDIDFAVVSQDKNVKRKTFKVLEGGKK